MNTSNSQFGQQSGYATLAAAVTMVFMSYLWYENVKKGQIQSRKAIDYTMKQDMLAEANKASLEIAAELLSTGAFQLVDQKQVKNFKTSLSGYEDHEKKQVYYDINVNYEDFKVKSGGIWEVQGNKLYINLCRPLNSTHTNTGAIMAGASELGNELAQANCSANSANFIKYRTEISGFKNYAFTDIRGKVPVWGHSHVYVASSTNQVGTDKTLNQPAFLRLPELSKKCDDLINNKDSYWEWNNKQVCDLDHCRFMEPLVDSNGVARYLENGDPYLVPNIDYKEFVDATAEIADSWNTDWTVKRPGDPEPTLIFDYYGQALSPGQRDPFQTEQGIYGKDLPDTDLILRDPDSGVQVNLNVSEVANTSTGQINLIDGSKGHVIFEGYLAFDPGEKRTFGSTTINWPKDIGYQHKDLQYLLHEGCRRTMYPEGGMPSDIDMCSRIRMPVLLKRYQYDYKRRCHYYGPTRDWKTINAGYYQYGDYPWEETGSAEEVGSGELFDDGVDHGQNDFWEETATPVEWLWTDNAAHDVLDRQNLRLNREIFSARIWGARKKEAYLYQYVPGTPAVEATDDTPEVPAGSATQYWRQKYRFEWSTSCTQTIIPAKTPGYYFEHLEELCFYVIYRDVLDKKKCSRRLEHICRNGNGCFVGDTKILMADGNLKPINQISAGDKIYNPMTGRAAIVKMPVIGPSERELYEFVLENHSEKITVSHEHPMTTRGGVVKAITVKEGDFILVEGNKFVKVMKITLINKNSSHPRNVYNLLLADEDGDISNLAEDHFLIANGMISGDWYVQTNLDSLHLDAIKTRKMTSFYIDEMFKEVE